MAAALRANGKVVLLGSELEYLGRVIGQVEQTTSGELRMMIVRRSGRVPLAGPLYFLSLSTLALIVMWFDRVQLLAAPEWTLPAVLFGAAVIGAALARWPRTAAWVYPQIDRRIAAQTRAEVEFHRQGITNTRDRTGILIFVSLFERQAVVMADEGIAAKCPPTIWNGVISTILQGARQKRWAPKLEDAIRQCGAILAEHCPLEAEQPEIEAEPERLAAARPAEVTPPRESAPPLHATSKPAPAKAEAATADAAPEADTFASAEPEPREVPPAVEPTASFEAKSATVEAVHDSEASAPMDHEADAAPHDDQLSLELEEPEAPPIVAAPAPTVAIKPPPLEIISSEPALLKPLVIKPIAAEAPAPVPQAAEVTPSNERPSEVLAKSNHAIEPAKPEVHSVDVDERASHARAPEPVAVAPQPAAPLVDAKSTPPRVNGLAHSPAKPRWQQIDEAAPNHFRKHKFNELPNDIIVDD